MMRQMFSIGERSRLQVGQFSTQALLLQSHAVVIAAVCGFALSCWNTQGLPWNRHCLEGSICCSKTFYIPFRIHSAFQNMQAAYIVWTYTPPYHQRCWLLNWWVMQCRLRARRPQASNKGLWPCPWRTEMSSVSLNLLMISCTVDEICKAFAIWCWGFFF